MGTGKYKKRPRLEEYLRGCRSKIRYDTEARARNMVEIIGRGSYYPCRYCGGYHTTSQSNKKKSPRPLEMNA